MRKEVGIGSSREFPRAGGCRGLIRWSAIIGIPRGLKSMKRSEGRPLHEVIDPIRARVRQERIHNQRKGTGPLSAAKGEGRSRSVPWGRARQSAFLFSSRLGVPTGFEVILPGLAFEMIQLVVASGVAEGLPCR